MVMDQFVTTYRKDYLWPYVKTLGLRPQPEQLYQPQYNDPNRPYLPCECHAMGDPMAHQNQQIRDLLGPQAYEEESWSRLGPMGPLLDPKMYPAKVSAAPETQISRFNQPNVFLSKLQEKYPFIYECLRTAPPDDLLARINRDRLRTTYQVDYCKMNEYPSAPYDELLRAAGVDGLPPCAEPVTLPGDVCKIYTRSKITESGGHGGSGKGGQPCGGIYKSKEAAYCVGSCKGALSSITSGATEYQDAISRLGQLIIRDRIHDPTVKREEIPYGTPMQMIRGARNDISPPCPEKTVRCGSPCKAPPRNKALRMSTITKQFVETSMPGRGQSQKSKACGTGITSWDPFAEKCSFRTSDEAGSRSIDIIDTWGHMIYRESTHRHHRLR